MRREDRELLSRLRRASSRLASDTMSVLGVDAADGRPSPEGLRALAAELDQVAEDLRARADQVANTVDPEPAEIESPQ